MGMEKALEGILRMDREEAGDYRGEDGLLYCGKCHTRKERLFPLPPSRKLVRVPVACQCRKEAMKREEQEKYQEERALARDRAFDFDTALTEKTFQNFRVTKDNEKLLLGAKNYAERFPEMLAENRGLLFLGDVGTGKSHLAAAITNALFDKGYFVRFTSLRNLTDEYMTAGFDAVDKARYLELIGKYSLLVLDDYGAERKTEFATETAFRLLEKRLLAKKPMLITTNRTALELLNPENLMEKRMTDRIVSVCSMVEFKGGSYRRKQARENTEKTLKELGFL